MIIWGLMYCFGCFGFFIRWIVDIFVWFISLLFVNGCCLVFFVICFRVCVIDFIWERRVFIVYVCELSRVLNWCLNFLYFLIMWSIMLFKVIGLFLILFFDCWFLILNVVCKMFKIVIMILGMFFLYYILFGMVLG